ncbi:MAG: acyl-CoA thioesterase [Planctomycetota bacterium]|nr:MAG: acyl-CoA thioesterase [Planctomycetota bacterium]
MDGERPPSAAPRAEAAPETVARVRVIYGDTDAMGIVYYGNYMRFLEVGRVEHLRALGKAYAEIEALGYQIPVAEVRLKYLRPARYDDVVEVRTRAEASRAAIRFDYRLVRTADGELLAKGFTRHACVDSARGRAVRLPAVLAELFAARTDPAKERNASACDR